ncbi:MAG: 16S rRNA (cytosine(1402)-N(4))-methyltransferase RsmH [Acidobacteria bacterium]|nr:MAG: 16S rRNA (cytosine(1402)-N(4))-methyltransferase RsmH [Acidobacteriota bacterium]
MSESDLHYPVMMREAMDFLNVQANGNYIDATAGAGGHSGQILRVLEWGQGRLLAIDRDSQALNVVRERLGGHGRRLMTMEGNFADICALHAASGLPPVDGILADLGLSSMQIEDAGRGFSFNLQGPLDMRMGGGELTAGDVVNRTPERELADLIFEFGEERHSRRIARAIVKARPIRSTTELAQVVMRAIPSRAGLHHIHPATRTFMALRLIVNHELENLEKFLADFPGVLAAGGRSVVVSFHSLEDRRVKHAFLRLQREGRMRVLTKHVVRPTPEEIQENPRSRSAKLRAAEKLHGA